MKVCMNRRLLLNHNYSNIYRGPFSIAPGILIFLVAVVAAGGLRSCLLARSSILTPGIGQGVVFGRGRPFSEFVGRGGGGGFRRCVMIGWRRRSRTRGGSLPYVVTFGSGDGSVEVLGESGSVSKPELNNGMESGFVCSGRRMS